MSNLITEHCLWKAKVFLSYIVNERHIISKTKQNNVSIGNEPLIALSQFIDIISLISIGGIIKKF